MTSVCMICENAVGTDPNTTIRCHICRHWAHSDCLEVPAEVCQFLHSDSYKNNDYLISFICANCTPEYEKKTLREIPNSSPTKDCFNVYIYGVPKTVTLRIVQESVLRILGDAKAAVNVYRISDVALGVELNKEEHVDALLANSNSLYVVDRPYALSSDELLQPFKDGTFILSNKIWLTLKKQCRQNNLSFTDDLCGVALKISREREDGPWIFRGKTKDLKAFEEKAKEILLFGRLADSADRDSADVDDAQKKLAGLKISSKEKRQKSDHSRSSQSIDACAICLFSLTKLNVDPKTTLECKHAFHTKCINRWLKVTSSCPTCRTIIPPKSGDQPMGGTCTLFTYNDKEITGYPDAQGYITVYYTVPNGVQDERHPNPGQLYSGTHRVAYLPNNQRGQKIAKMLQKAFEQLFIFKVGTSATTGVTNTVVWSGLIPHRTSFHGGRDYYGYPDPEYLDDVEIALRRLGITI